LLVLLAFLSSATAVNGLSRGVGAVRPAEVHAMRDRTGVARVVGVTMAAMGVAGAASAQVEAVEWRVEDGGNGHWYRVVVLEADVQWAVADALAGEVGGHLATLTSATENAWVHALAISTPLAFQSHGPWLGGIRGDRGWQWVTGEAWNFVAWSPTNPSGDGVAMGFWESGMPAAASWNDAPESNSMTSLVLEWSADCDQNGLVDYGEIVRGEKTDANANGIPDCCESSAGCCPGDVDGDGAVNGIDLAIVLARWGGPSKDYPRADANDDGTVDGADLAALLGAWGSCE
jgi:hypothetical protein